MNDIAQDELPEELPQELTEEAVEEGGDVESPPHGLRDSLVREVRDHPFAYSVLAAFLPLGPLCAWWLFPDAPMGAVVIGGLAFSGYAALCAVPGKFL